MKGYGVARWSVLAGILVCLLLPTVAAEETLVARLPMGLEGDIQADATGAVFALAADAAGTAPTLEMTLSAPKARVFVTNFTTVETASGLGGPVPDSHDGSSSSTWVDDAEFRVGRLGAHSLLVAYDGSLTGGDYRATPLDRQARLDLATQDSLVSYTDDPDGLNDFDDVAVSRGDLLFIGDDVHYDIVGDFTFFVYGTTLSVLEPNGTRVHETGTWVTTTEASAGPLEGPTVERRTTTQYVRIDLYDATLSATASGGDQKIVAEPEGIMLDIDGAISTSGTAGSLKVGDETIRSKGDRVHATGSFTLVPTYVVDTSSKQVVFAMQGAFETLSVGPSAYTAAGAVVAATGFALVLAAAGAYFWEWMRTLLFVPLYAKLTKDKVLDQDTRSAVHEKIRHDPGCQVKDVADALDISWTTAAYHARVLHKMGLVVGRRKGRHTHFFVTGSTEAAAFEVSSVLKNDTARDIVQLVLRHPGIIQKEICERLSIAPSTASWHLSRLRDASAIEEIKDWKMRRYFAGEALDGVPIHLGRLEADPIHAAST